MQPQAKADIMLPPAMNVLLFLHIPKTGGTSLTRWARKLPVNHYSYLGTECFLCDPHHAGLFAKAQCKHFNATVCERRLHLKPLAHNSSVFVEFHANK